MAQGMLPVAVPGKNPGEIYIPALDKTFKQVELREDDVYDSVLQASGTLTAGTELTFFRTLDNKKKQHVNIVQAGRMKAGTEGAIFRIGLHTRGAHGNTVPAFNDHKKILENGYLLVKFNDRVVAEGPAIKFSSGYGLAGHSDETGVNAVSVGVPSAAAAPTLFVPQQLTPADDLDVQLFFPDAQWITSYAAPVLGIGVVTTLFLHGILKKPLGF